MGLFPNCLVLRDVVGPDLKDIMTIVTVVSVPVPMSSGTART